MQVLIGIPVYNEEKHIADILEAVTMFGHDVLVVDDCSTDSTPSILKKFDIRTIRHEENHGVGRTLQEMFRWSSKHKYDWLVTLDSDGQHDPAEIANFVKVLEEDSADIVSGSRYLESVLANDTPPKERETINRQVTQELNASLGIQITDTFTGYKAYRVASLHAVDIDVDGYAFPIQFWVQAAVGNLRIQEIPIRLIYNDLNRRFGGELDDPVIRLDYYRAILCRELTKYKSQLPHAMEHVPC